MDRKKLLRIVVPVFIILVVAGIWFFKNTGREPMGSQRLPDHPDFVLEATAIDLESLTSHGIPVIVDFGADACIPCREMAPVLELLNEEMQGLAVIKFVDVWKYSEAAQGFPLNVIPTQVFFTAEGKPYMPSEDVNIPFTMYESRATGEHVLTVHQGGLTQEEMRAILADMGVNE